MSDNNSNSIGKHPCHGVTNGGSTPSEFHRKEGTGNPFPIKFAIIESNVLASLGLKQLLEDIMPIADIDIFSSIDEIKLSDSRYIHYFVSSRLYFENTNFFHSFAHQIIVLVAGDMQIAGVMTLNVCQSEYALTRAVLKLQNTGHRHNAKAPADVTRHQQKQDLLSAREIEVAVLLSKGLINKEIADRLNISITTVITHRKNIMDKLHARSLADIIIFAVMNGFIDVGEI